ncbi:MAG: hypothetical protein A4S08_06220 [Proteobacteria bacterium SG_bin4]|nr:MAG: hypothetical protein A4S08_06220 [Proteobacteria bacterium SG_bin4]
MFFRFSIVYWTYSDNRHLTSGLLRLSGRKALLEIPVLYLGIFINNSGYSLILILKSAFAEVIGNQPPVI